MKGLDAHIMGLNDPNAPFNQVDWVDFYDPLLDHCEWITDEMIDDDTEYAKLGEAFDRAYTKFVGDKWIPKREIIQFMVENAGELAKMALTEFSRG